MRPFPDPVRRGVACVEAAGGCGEVEHYLYLVPFVTGADGTRFLKTIIPSRKATRHYR